MNLDVMLWFMGQLIVGAAIWGGIRMDIKNMHKRIDALHETAHDAHKRIDGILSNRNK